MTEFKERGQRLWDHLLERDPDLDEESNPTREIAITACRTADRVDSLELACESADPVIDFGGRPLTNPLFIEVRQQAALLARLIAALRLPDVAAGKRPQRRQLRGVQQPSALSALERARAAKSS